MDEQMKKFGLGPQSGKSGTWQTGGREKGRNKGSWEIGGNLAGTVPRLGTYWEVVDQAVIIHSRIVLVPR